MEHNLTQTGMRILRLMIGHAPKKLAALIDETGVTRTAVMEQLMHLMEAGYVERITQRTGRGRPHHLYSTTDAAQTLFPSNQSLIFPALLHSIQHICGDNALQQVLEDVGRQLASHYTSRISAQTPHERLAQFAELLKAEGLLADVQYQNGRWTLLERSCPYFPILGHSRTACQLEKSMMSLVLNAPVEMLDCRLDGCSSCSSQVEAATPEE